MRRALSMFFALGVVVSATLGSLPGGATEGGGSSADQGAALAPVQVTPMEKPTLTSIRPRWVEGQVLVQWSPGIDRAKARTLHARRGAQVLSRIGAFGGIDVVALPRGMSVERGLRSYRRAAGVKIVEPNLLRDWDNHVTAPFNDTHFAELWGLDNTGQTHRFSEGGTSTVTGLSDRDIDAPEAWARPHPNNNPVIAVVDSGARTTHEDLVGQLWVNPGEVPGTPGVDDDGNGLVDDINGWNFGDNNANIGDIAPGDGHGTHVAATIAAAAKNGKGIAGVCPQCRIMVLKFNLTLASELKAFAYARQKGASVVNGSFGGGAWSRLERNAIRQMGNAGILAVFSAGNAAFDNDMFLSTQQTFSPSFPSSYTLPNILAVAASTDRDEYGFSTKCRQGSSSVNPKWLCAFTSFGAESVDVAAPGVDVFSASKTSDTSYVVYDGTSMASPHVSGIAGLIKSAFPARGHQAIKNAIMRGVDKPSSLRTMHSFIFEGKATGRFTRTGGRVNANAALTAGTTNATQRTDGNIDGAKAAKATNRGRVAYPADVNDVFKRRLQKGKVYTARLNVPRGKDYDLWVYKPGTTEIHQLEPSCFAGRNACRILAISALGTGKNEIIRFRAPRSGVFFFQVQAWLKNAGRYVLTIKKG